jgi:hypothetical protein
VERGDYQMIRAADSQTIDPSEFARTVAPEMKFEMSIIVRKRAAFQKSQGKCPRCFCINYHVPAANGWIEWKVSFSFRCLLIINTLTYSCGCEGQFQIAEAAPKHQDNENGDDDSDSDGTSNVWDDVASDGGSSEEVVGANDAAEDVEDIISPASYVSFVRGVTIVTLLDLVDQTMILQTHLMPKAYDREMTLSSSAVYASFFGQPLYTCPSPGLCHPAHPFPTHTLCRLNLRDTGVTGPPRSIRRLKRHWM